MKHVGLKLNSTILTHSKSTLMLILSILIVIWWIWIIKLHLWYFVTFGVAYRRQTWIKCVLRCWIHSMHDIWGLYNLTPQRYLTHERLSHNLYRGLLHLRDRRNLLPFWDVVGASIESIPTKYHTLGTTFTGWKTSQAFTSSTFDTFLWRR